MIKRFLLPLSVAALMMSGTITYAGEISQPAEAAETAVAAGTEFETEEAGTEEIFGTDIMSYYFMISNNEVTITGLSGADGIVDLNIPAEINGLPVRYIKAKAFQNKTNIRSVVFPEGLFKIEDNAFQNCKALQSVQMSSSITSIGKNCFDGDTSLQTVQFSKDGQLKTIGSYAFNDTIVTSVDLPDALTTIGSYAFYNCKSLQSVQFGKNTKTIGFRAFQGNVSLTGIEFPEGLETIAEGAFYSCTNLSGKIVIPSTVTEIGQPLQDMLWENSPSGAFEGTAIQEVEIKDGNEPLVLDDYSFKNCKQLEKVTFSSRLKNIGTEAFKYCSKLKEAVFEPGSNSLEIGEKAFEEAAVEQIDFPSNTKSIGESAFYNCTSLKQVTFDEGLQTIGRGAFYNCTALKCDIVLPSTVQTIEGADADNGEGKSAFENTPIKSLIIKNGTTQLTIGKCAFRNCTNLRYAELSDRVVEIGYSAFENNSKLAWVRIGNGIYQADIGECAFKNDTCLKALVLPRLCTVGYDILTGCTKLKDIYYASTETTYNNYVTVDKSNNVYKAAVMHYESTGPDPMPETAYTGWEKVDGKKYWYEKDVLQGYDASNPDYRGKEIYDPDSDAWYWLDNVQGGAVAVSKDVYQESYAGEYADREDGTGKWVRYDKNGHMVKGFDRAENGTYYFDLVYGAMVKGLQTIDGKLYYFDPVTGIMQTGAININGMEYAFDTDGTALDNRWYTIEGKEYWYENGVRQGYDPDNTSYRGKEIYDSKSDAWYWLDNVQGGAMAVGKDVYQESDGGKWVRYNRFGEMVKGWGHNDTYGGYNYFDKITGAMYKGWHNIDGKDYYFDANTGIMH